MPASVLQKLVETAHAHSRNAPARTGPRIPTKRPAELNFLFRPKTRREPAPQEDHPKKLSVAA